jgi:hypothetical protein
MVHFFSVEYKVAAISMGCATLMRGDLTADYNGILEFFAGKNYTLFRLEI